MDTFYHKDTRRIQDQKVKRKLFWMALLLAVLPRQIATLLDVNDKTLSFAKEELSSPPLDVGLLLSYASNMFNTTTTTTTKSKKKPTKIIGFSDKKYKEIAWNWYQKMEQLGYNEHVVVAQDGETANYFQQKGMRYDLVYNKSNNNNSNTYSSLREECDKEYKHFDKPFQTYRRMLFGSRWNYVLLQLQAGYPILLTDVDNVFTRHRPLTEMEDSEYDVFHAYAGVINSFPQTVYQKMGFTVCGGMSWMRPIQGVIEFVTAIVELCNCQVLQCSCHCDDQVVINQMIYNHPEYKYQWDTADNTADTTTTSSVVVLPESEQEASWESRTGTCTKTGHRVKIWDRHMAFRNHLDPEICPDPAKNWIAMPTKADRQRVWEQWRETCPNNNNKNASSSK